MLNNLNAPKNSKLFKKENKYFLTVSSYITYLHFTAGYILYNYVCEEYKSWI